LAMLLEVSGHVVCIANSGAEALEIGARERPDACILDIGMPEMNGYEVARRVREQAGSGKILLVAVTGWGQDGDKSRALAAGFDRHFTKPVDPERLLELLRAESARPPA
ncbi:MAG: response regulator, partial [Casimicrobiaceae bacterium]